MLNVLWDKTNGLRGAQFSLLLTHLYSTYLIGVVGLERLTLFREAHYFTLLAVKIHVTKIMILFETQCFDFGKLFGSTVFCLMSYSWSHVQMCVRCNTSSLFVVAFNHKGGESLYRLSPPYDDVLSYGSESCAGSLLKNLAQCRVDVHHVGKLLHGSSHVH